MRNVDCGMRNYTPDTGHSAFHIPQSAFHTLIQRLNIHIINANLNLNLNLDLARHAGQSSERPDADRPRPVRHHTHGC